MGYSRQKSQMWGWIELTDFKKIRDGVRELLSDMGYHPSTFKFNSFSTVGSFLILKGEFKEYLEPTKYFEAKVNTSNDSVLEFNIK